MSIQCLLDLVIRGNTLDRVLTNLIKVILFGLVCSFFSLSVSAADAGDATLKRSITVGIPPHAYLVGRVGGERVQVSTLVGAGANPHNYEVTPGQISALAKSSIYFRAGIEFEEGLVPKLVAMFPDLLIVDLRQGVEPLVSVECHEAHDHSDHDHSRMVDPHMWLSPLNASIQAATIARALCQIDPGGTLIYQRNLATLQQELMAVHNDLKVILAPYRGKSVYVYHPAFGYFCAAYGLNQVAVEIEGKEPAPRQIATLIANARASGSKVIFVQPQFNPRSAQIIATAINGVVVELDDLSPDFINNLRKLAVALKSAIEVP